MVELAGGIWSPIAHDGDGLDLTAALAPDHIVLVADAGLGTINAIRPAVAALSPDRAGHDPAQPLRPRRRSCTAATWPGWRDATGSTWSRRSPELADVLVR